MQTRVHVVESLSKDMISEIHVDGTVLRFQTSDSGSEYRAKTTLTKELDTIAWIDSFDAAEIFWDIGANIGTFSVYAGRHRGVRTLCFEPAAANYSALVRNILLNELDRKVTAFCLAFSGTTQVGVLNLESDRTGSATNQFGEFGDRSPYSRGSTKVRAQGMIAYSVDEFVRVFRTPIPSHIKIDVDGLEIDILRGAVETLRNPAVRSILIELPLKRMEETNEAISILGSIGFRLDRRGQEQGVSTNPGANHIFIR
jgi:FkbM family methyltransferase